jgi:ABC-type transport system involved in multi-copper enzyme maturation permease subunit
MFLACLRKELLLNLKSMRFLLTALLLISAIIGATAVRTHIYRQQLDGFQKARTKWLRVRQDACDAPTSFLIGMMAERPPNPLAIFAGGVENEMSRSVTFYYEEWQGELEPLSGARRLNSPAFRQFIYPDAAMLIALVGSLFALVLMFDAICGEREQGTLRLLLAGPLPRDTLLLAKAVAGLVTLTEVLAESHAISIDEAANAGTARWLARLSPLGCLQNACLLLAGTGTENEIVLRTSLEGFSRDT